MFNFFVWKHQTMRFGLNSFFHSPFLGCKSLLFFLMDEKAIFRLVLCMWFNVNTLSIKNNN